MTAIRIIDSHLELADIGSNTHAQIDTELSSLRDVSSAADSPMIITGGEISEGTNAGTFKVAALTAMLRSTNSSIGDLVAVSLAEQDDQAITVVDTVYTVALNYNGGAPTISIETSNPYNADKRNIPIGQVMKDGSNVVHYISGGFNLQDGVRKLHERAKAVRALELQSGSAIGYSGVDNFTMTEGIVYGGLNKFILSSYDSAAVTFLPVYQDGGGGWTEGAASNAIDCLHYDDGSGALATVGNNKYGCFWVYKHIEDDHVYVLYGRDSYTLAEAETASEPTRPDHLAYFGLLIGKIIAPKAGGSFTEVQMVTDIFFSGVATADHNNLGGLQGGVLGEYYHLTSAELTKLGGVAEGAEVNVQSDWNAVDGDALILNKPSDLTDLSGHNVTELSDVTGAGSGIIISAAERTKLNGIEESATADQTKTDIDALGLSHDSLVDVSADDHHAELHSIASHNDTSATGAQLDTLTNNSIANALHRHSELVASDGDPDPALSVDAVGNIGIGISSPSRKLHVYSGGSGGTAVTTSDVVIEDDDHIFLEFLSPNDKIQGIMFSDADDPYRGYIRYSHVDDSMQLYTNGGSKLIILSGGDIGINDPTPSEKLDVGGNVRADDYLEYSRPLPIGDALTVILGMKNKKDGTLDHSTFPEYTTKEIEIAEVKDEDGKVIKEAKTITKESISLSLQVKYLIKAVQELNVRVDAASRAKGV